MTFPNYVPPKNPQRLGKIIMFYRFLEALRNADNEITSWVILTPTGEFRIVPYHEDDDTDPINNQIFLDTAVHKSTLKAGGNDLGPRATDNHDAMRPIFMTFWQEWKIYRKVQLRAMRKKELVHLI